jgi:RNA polymerase sigma factor (sigma-70 family)
MLRSREDAEDVLQEVFVAAFNAMIADDRPLNVQPWLYRIARNRSLNHLRRVKAISVDPMEMPEGEAGAGTAETVHHREELRLLVSDIQKLPETQRSAIVLREMEALTYDQIAEVMEKSVPSVKSLLVRARVSLAAAREARASEKGLAALIPVGPAALLKRVLLSHVGHSTGVGATAAGAGSAMVAGSSTGGMVVAGIGAMATKTAAGLTAAALVTAGAVAIESDHGRPDRHHRAPPTAYPTAPAPLETANASRRATRPLAAVEHAAEEPHVLRVGTRTARTSPLTAHTATATAAAATAVRKTRVAEPGTRGSTADASTHRGAEATITTDSSRASTDREQTPSTPASVAPSLSTPASIVPTPAKPAGATMTAAAPTDSDQTAAAPAAVPTDSDQTAAAPAGAAQTAAAPAASITTTAPTMSNQPAATTTTTSTTTPASASATTVTTTTDTTATSAAQTSTVPPTATTTTTATRAAVAPPPTVASSPVGPDAATTGISGLMVDPGKSTFRWAIKDRHHHQHRHPRPPPTQP